MSIRKNIIANLIGRFWGVLSNFLFIPLYIKILGIENYSLISFSLVIAGLMAFLDAGLTSTLSREFALKTNNNDEKIRVLKTLESCYLLIAGFIIVILFLISSFIANNWLNLDSVDPIKVSFYLRIIGIGISFQLLANFYIGGLFGLEKQVKANVYQIAWGIFKNGFILIPIFYWPSLDLFFIWQSVCTVIYVFLLRDSLINSLSTKISIFRSHSIDFSILTRIWKFAGGMLLIFIVAGINTQMDKIAISKLLPLSVLGGYTLAVSMAQGIVILINPIATAVLPRFTSLYSENKNQEVSSLFRNGFFLITILVFSFCFSIIFNSRDLLWIWTGNTSLADLASQYIPFLTIGMTMLALQILPYNIAIAKGHTKLNTYLGITSLIFTIPGYWFMTKQYGAWGAGLTWCITQCIFTPIYLFYINQLFLKRKYSYTSIIKEFILPVLFTLLFSWILSEINFFAERRFSQFLWIGFCTLLTFFLCLFILLKKEERKFLATFLKFSSINDK